MATKKESKSTKVEEILPTTSNEPQEVEETQIEFSGAPNTDKVWSVDGEIHRLRDKGIQLNNLDVAVYTLGADRYGFFLERQEDSFVFDHKIYGLEVALINRVIKTYNSSKGNLGVLLNGVKGTGKTVTAKVICNQLKMPVVIVPVAIENCNLFLNGIPQDIIIFIDEYEKVFPKDADNSVNMLSIMDGAMNSVHRRLFLLTTNQLYINENLIQRPGRVRYLKTFSDLRPEIIEEIIDDRLKHKEFKNEALKFISNLEIITVDIVNSIIDEINIHKESPDVFKDVFNVKKISGKYNIYFVDEEGKTTEFKKGVPIHPRKLDVNEDELVGYYFEVDGERIGRIVEVVGRSILRIQPDPGRSAVIEEPSETRKKSRTTKQLVLPSFVIKVEDADTVNWKYRYNSANMYDF